ncbi:MAG: acetate--CoA ligase [Steroidobacteraceae bacterium]|nr:acetate--CoA ligase [Steroidobacteraceae bacterium]
MDEKIYPVPERFAATTTIKRADYVRQYAQSVATPEDFWGRVARRIDWIRPFTRVKDTSFDATNCHVRWFEDGQLNVSSNCLDRHLHARGDKTAIIWEGDDPKLAEHISYRELHERVCQCANALKSLGVQRGDRVTIYLPMVPEIAISMLACARIGAIHSVVFAGFSPEALGGRIADCDSSVVITADEGIRGGKRVALKKNVDGALSIKGTECVKNVLVVRRTGVRVPMYAPRDRWYEDLVSTQPKECPATAMGAEDPLFILYTSGSTGKPKGVLHTTGGYLVYAAYTHECIFDLRDDDIYWATADLGWVTGHSYVLYGPLANGATTLMFEGVPTYPDSGRFWQIVDKHRVTIFYSSPTAIRSLMREGEEPVTAWSRNSLRLLGSVGEPINPEAWEWYHRVVGNGRCPIVDTWWQTETGGILISPFAGATDLKPGSAALPFFGVRPAIVDGEGRILEDACEGNLVILDSWPGQMRTVYGDHERFVETYFKTFPGMYVTGDGARRDIDGYYWITGRVDDVINVAGHRLGTAEIESALVAHPKVAESAVVGFPHDVKGQGIYAYVTLIEGAEPTEALRTELRDWVRREISPIATPDAIQWAPGLPKTRSGKIMRRILRKIAAGESDQIGDISTLADPAVVEELLAAREERH